MMINGVSSSKVLRIYGDKKNVEQVKPVKKQGDVIEISEIGKKLAPYSMDHCGEADEKRINELRDAVKNGTYKVDSRLFAQKMLDSFNKRL